MSSLRRFSNDIYEDDINNISKQYLFFPTFLLYCYYFSRVVEYYDKVLYAFVVNHRFFLSLL